MEEVANTKRGSLIVLAPGRESEAQIGKKECRSGIRYSSTLYNHIPVREDELLVRFGSHIPFVPTYHVFANWVLRSKYQRGIASQIFLENEQNVTPSAPSSATLLQRNSRCAPEDQRQ